MRPLPYEIGPSRRVRTQHYDVSVKRYILELACGHTVKRAHPRQRAYCEKCGKEPKK